MSNYYLNHTGAQLDEAIRKVLNGELNVPLQEKTVTPTTAQQTVVPDSDYKGLSKVTVNSIPQSYIDEVYSDGYNKGLEEATPTLQSKTVTPTTSSQIVAPDTNYDGLSQVTVNAIPQSYTDEVYNQGYTNGYDEGIEATTTSLLLHGDSITDSSIYNRGITNNGVTTSTAQSKFGGSSLYFNGSAYMLIDPYEFGSGDFTIDWWEYITSSSSAIRFSAAYTTTTYGGLLLGYNGTNLYVSTDINNSWNLVNGAKVFSNTLNTWTHWAVVRSGGTLSVYRNGNLVYSYNIGTNIIASSRNYKMAIGQYRPSTNDSNSKPIIGYIDEFRISSVARWTSNFTPPTEAYSL